MFTMNAELMGPDGGANKALGTELKLADTVEVGIERRRSYAVEGVRRARTEEVESDDQHFSNEHDEVCNETFFSFNLIPVAVSRARNSAGTRSIFGFRSKN